MKREWLFHCLLKIYFFCTHNLFWNSKNNTFIVHNKKGESDAKLKNKSENLVRSSILFYPRIEHIEDFIFTTFPILYRSSHCPFLHSSVSSPITNRIWKNTGAHVDRKFFHKLFLCRHSSLLFMRVFIYLFRHTYAYIKFLKSVISKAPMF